MKPEGDSIQQCGTFTIGYQKNVQQKGDVVIATIQGSDSKDFGALLLLLRDLRNNLSSLPLDEESRAQVTADSAALEAQIAAPRPNSTILRASSKSLYDILIGVAGNASWTGISSLLPILYKFF